MIRGYTREIHLRVSTDCVENVWHTDPAMPRFEDLGLYYDGSEDCDIYLNGQVGRRKKWRG